MLHFITVEFVHLTIYLVLVNLPYHDVVRFLSKPERRFDTKQLTISLRTTRLHERFVEVRPYHITVDRIK
jgi:hypothetical protein